jgi:hypothetical protein
MNQDNGLNAFDKVLAWRSFCASPFSYSKRSNNLGKLKNCVRSALPRSDESNADDEGNEDDEDDENNEDDDFSLLFTPAPVTCTEFTSRDWYVLPRSSRRRQARFLSQESSLEITFKTSFRMSRQSFFSLHALLQPHIERPQTHLHTAISSERRLAVFLYHIAQGAGYAAISNQFGIHRSTVSSIIGDVSKAITVHILKRYIRFPNVDEASRTMEFWRQKSGIPGIVACIDGFHIPIAKPDHSADSYCNRKGFYSMNVQGYFPPRWVSS